MDRLTKEELKAPDKILIVSRSMFSWAEQQWGLLLGAVAAIFVTVVGISLFIQYQTKQESKAQLYYGKAKAFFEQTRVGGDKEKSEAKQNLVKELDALRAEFPRSKAAGMAGLLRAHLLIDDKKYAEALTELKAFEDSLPKSERELGSYPLAVSYEQTGDFAKALEGFSRIVQNEKSGFLQEAYLGKARAERALKKNAEAQKTYEKFIEKFPQSAEISVVRGLLAELGAAK